MWKKICATNITQGKRKHSEKGNTSDLQKRQKVGLVQDEGLGGGRGEGNKNMRSTSFSDAFFHKLYPMAELQHWGWE